MMFFNHTSPRSSLTPRERLHAVLSRQLPDRIPLRLIYASAEQIRSLWPDQPSDDPLAMMRWEHDHHFTHGSVPGGFLRPVVFDDGDHYQIQCETGARVDCRRKPVSNTHYYDQPIRSRSDLDNFRTPDLDDPRRYEGVKETIDRFHQAGCFVAVHVLGTFQGSNLMMRPFTDLLMDIVTNPEFAAQLLEVYTNFLIEDVCRRLEMGADGVYVCDDLGMNDRLMMRPEQYRAIIKPLHQKQVQRFKQFPNAKVMLHCDGCVRAIMDDLVEVGFDEINPVDPADHMFIEELKPAYGEQISLAGGFDRHIGQMAVEELLEHIEKVIAVGKPGGRYIAVFPTYPEMDNDCMLQAVRRIEQLSTYA